MKSKFTVSTDKEEKVQLESKIVRASWLSPVAHGGFYAKVEVKTVFVSEGSPIEITGYSSKGSPPGTIKGYVFNNTFRGELFIPKNVVPYAEIWYEANLPKHGVKKESFVIPARPPVGISKLAWDRNVITREEVATLTCEFVSGVCDGDEVFFIIYEHNPDSCDLKVTTIPANVEGSRAEIQWEFDYKDDTEQIPTDEEKKKIERSYINPQYYFVVSVNGIKAGVNRESGLLVFKDWIETQVMLGNEPCKNSDIKFFFADGTEQAATTDENGMVKVENISPGKFEVELIRLDSTSNTEKPDSTFESSDGDNGFSSGIDTGNPYDSPDISSGEPGFNGNDSGESNFGVTMDTGFSGALSGGFDGGGSMSSGLNNFSSMSDIDSPNDSGQMSKMSDGLKNAPGVDPAQEADDADKWGFDIGGNGSFESDIGFEFST